VVSVEAGVERDLERLGVEARDSALAELALALAAEIDEPKNSATSKAMCAKALMDTMAALRALAPPKKEADQADDLAERRRAARRARGSAS
jgi:hypothetical protein